jgi:hypothetical protein
MRKSMVMELCALFCSDLFAFTENLKKDRRNQWVRTQFRRHENQSLIVIVDWIVV